MFNLFKKKPAKYQSINAAEFAALREKENHVVLDVRTPNELGEGFVPGHILINLFSMDFKSQVSKLDKSQSYLVYCRSGKRSARACSMMAKLGFTNLYSLQGGIGAWNKMNKTS